MNKLKLTNLINEKEKILNAYETKKVKSKVYTDEEIEKKRHYFLSLIPSKETDISLQRWHYEIKRVFELCKDFKKCPDKWFYHLETFIRYGI